MNFEDPEVFERMIGSDFKNLWKTTYGFDYVTKLPAEKVLKNNQSVLVQDALTAFGKYCLKAEFR
jgi:hypothetical protein